MGPLPRADVASMLSVENIRAALDGSIERANALPRAGVAVVLTGAPQAPELCLVQRAARRGDRWSGDIALPGGWAREHERTFRDTAARETAEEVGITLRAQAHLGDIAPMHISRGGEGSGLIAASVYYLGAHAPSFSIDEREIADAFWFPVAALFAPDNRRTVNWSRSGPPQPRPGVDVGGRVLWGLTYRLLVRLSQQVLGGRSPLNDDPD